MCCVQITGGNLLSLFEVYYDIIPESVARVMSLCVVRGNVWLIQSHSFRNTDNDTHTGE